MEAPQFLVLSYFLVWAACECITLGLVGLGYIDVVGLRYRTMRAYVEAWLVRATSQACLAILIFIGGFWA